MNIFINKILLPRSGSFILLLDILLLGYLDVDECLQIHLTITHITQRLHLHSGSFCFLQIK